MLSPKISVLLRQLRQRRGEPLQGTAAQRLGAAAQHGAALPQVLLLQPLQELQRGGENHPEGNGFLVMDGKTLENIGKHWKTLEN